MEGRGFYFACFLLKAMQAVVVVYIWKVTNTILTLFFDEMVLESLITCLSGNVVVYNCLKLLYLKILFLSIT